MPPIGVKGPSQPRFELDIAWKDKIKILKEKSKVPIIKRLTIYLFSFIGKIEIINNPSP